MNKITYSIALFNLLEQTFALELSAMINGDFPSSEDGSTYITIEGPIYGDLNISTINTGGDSNGNSGGQAEANTCLGDVADYCDPSW